LISAPASYFEGRPICNFLLDAPSETIFNLSHDRFLPRALQLILKHKAFKSVCRLLQSSNTKIKEVVGEIILGRNVNKVFFRFPMMFYVDFALYCCDNLTGVLDR
jgi:hypothetical protein